MINIPNWVENKLTIWGTREDLIGFADQAKGMDDEENQHDLCLKNFIPMPKELECTTSPSKPNKILIKKYGASNWYDWRLKNYGTKWDVYNAVLDKNGLFHVNLKYERKIKKIIYGFNSAWSPPEIAILKIGNMFPQLKFKLEYWEGATCFQGVFIVENGQVIKSKTYTYSGKMGG